MKLRRKFYRGEEILRGDEILQQETKIIRGMKILRGVGAGDENYPRRRNFTRRPELFSRRQKLYAE